MKKVKVINHKNNSLYGGEFEDPAEFINFNITSNAWGRPERWILAASEPYEPADVLQTEERTFSYTVQELNELGHTVEVVKERSETWVLLRAEYTIEIEDITEALKNEVRIKELKQLLVESDYRMTADYYATMSATDQTKWTSDRAAWRSELRSLLEGA